MPRIIELDAHVADLIAAGEVVERPASVVKELMENAVDAGATVVTVEIKAGGMTYIRVTDNGCGIAPDDAARAFLRHATSKLSSADGLEAIGTLGFRGEALAAIAAVSRIELTTRETGTIEGARVTLEGGAVTERSPVGCPEGTTIIVRDLFFNTPARHKFMKTDRAEGSGVSAAVLRCALSRPEVSFRYIKDGKEELHTPGDSRVDSCIYSAFGRDFSMSLARVSSEDENVTVEGYVSRPEAARGNRNHQFFFVNGRYIRSRTLQAALEQAYKNSIFTGRYPACVLYITVRLSAVDVNVHPAKTEVRFMSDRQVFDGVYCAALGALESGSISAVPSVGRGTLGLVSEPPGGRGFSFAKEEREIPEARHDGRGVPGGSEGLDGAIKDSGFRSMDADAFRERYSPGTFKTGVPASREIGPYDRVSDETVERYRTILDGQSGATSDFRVIGEAFGTYIIAERGDSLWFIDKHAAHERIHFDALKRENAEIMAQSLIEPCICRLSPEDITALLENAELIEGLGFTVESFGEGAVALRRIPGDIDVGEAGPVLGEICENLRRGNDTLPGQRRDKIISAVACKAAIKSGRNSTARELSELASRVLSGEISYCPHGRPIATMITKRSIDKNHKRA